MNDVFISVIITAYNRKEFLLDAIKSALKQTLPKDKYEIIVIKNFKDNLIDDFINENNIKSILMEGTIGEFIYTGIKESKGNIISFLDDDDLFFSNKLEYVYNLFKNNSKLVYYHNLPIFIDDNNHILKKSNHSKEFNMSCISIKKNIIDNDDVRKIFILQDTLMYYFALDSKGKIISNKETLTYYRFHNSVSNAIGDLESRNAHKLILFKKYLSQLETMFKTFKSKRVKKLMFNYTISLKLEINILHKLAHINTKEKIKMTEILKYLFIFNYWDSRKFYIFKYIKLIELYILPKKLCKFIESLI